MLKSLRKKTKIIIWAVVLSFMLWGGFSVGVQFQKKGRYAGEVFGKDVSFQEFNRFYRLSQLFSPAAKTGADVEETQRRTWETIILSREAKQRGIKVSDDEVRQQVHQIFKAQGVEALTPEYYQRWLDSFVKLPPRIFENQLRELIRAQKLVASIYQAPLDAPSKVAAKKQFLEDFKKIKTVRFSFSTVEEAAGFVEKYREIQDLDLTLTEFPAAKKETLDKMDKEAFIAALEINRNIADRVFFLKDNGMSDPLHLDEEFAVFVVSETEEADDSIYDEAMEKQMTDILIAKKRDMELLKWNLDIFRRANLKDYSGETQL